MRLIDTCVWVWVLDHSSPLHKWAFNEVSRAVSGPGAAVSAVSVAELYSYSGRDASSVGFRLRSMQAKLMDVPVLASEICGNAYRKYLETRKTESQKEGPKTPLGDFFIGAHAELMGWEVVTGDDVRFRNYFPTVKLIVPAGERGLRDLAH